MKNSDPTFVSMNQGRKRVKHIPQRFAFTVALLPSMNQEKGRCLPQKLSSLHSGVVVFLALPASMSSFLLDRLFLPSSTATGITKHQLLLLALSSSSRPRSSSAPSCFSQPSL
ncbi:unnamed protein product [Linum trigynum]|uniref:Uncharacterized protein n=1 Tax=Linum trigynum TaxID=586398 RepID=A0AAV2DWA8_9ROSI